MWPMGFTIVIAIVGFIAFLVIREQNHEHKKQLITHCPKCGEKIKGAKT